jgi:hypothetical protein
MQSLPIACKSGVPLYSQNGVPFVLLIEVALELKNGLGLGLPDASEVPGSKSPGSSVPLRRLEIPMFH